LLLLKLCCSHGNRQLLCQCLGDIYRKDKLHWSGFRSQLGGRDRGLQDHAPVQRMSRRHVRYSQVEWWVTYKSDAHLWPFNPGNDSWVSGTRCLLPDNLTGYFKLLRSIPSCSVRTTTTMPRFKHITSVDLVLY
jgi:hypothetical protein